MNYKKQSLIVVALVFIVAGIIYVVLSRESSGNTSKELTVVEDQNINKQTYQSSATYQVPRGTETIDVEVTLEDKKIVDVQVKHSGFDNHSAAYQRSFDSAYKSEVIGKNIDEVNLDVIAGASDTTFGFIQALQNIESQI